MKKIIKIFIILLFVLNILFSFSQTAEAAIGTGIFDFSIKQMTAVKTQADPISHRIILILFLAIIGWVFLTSSASLLEWVITNPEWLTLNNPIVESGLFFVTGITNLLIILLLIFIAIAYILKIETFQVKKALPKLIMVALFVNFARVFIGIPIDIATILHRTILDAVGGSIVLVSMEALFGGFWNTIASIGSWIISLMMLFVIPFVGPFSKMSFVVFVASAGAFLPSFMSWLIQTFLAFLLGGIFLTLAFLFAARIFVIWFLTIFAPLAFICIVLPQTQKHWSEWLKHLFEWIFFGLIVLFFLAIGLTGAQYLSPGGAPPAIPGFMHVSLGDYFGYYFFLFVFLAVTAFLAQKFAPVLAQTLISQAQQIGGAIMSYGVKPLGEMTKKSAVLQAYHYDQDKDEYDRQVEEAKKTGREPPPLPRRLKFGGWGSKGIGKAYYLATGEKPGAAVRKDIEKKENDLKNKGYNAKELAELAPDLDNLGKAAVALRLGLLEAEKGLRKLKAEDFEKATKTIYELGTSSQKKQFNKFARPIIEENGELEKWVNSREVGLKDVERLIKDEVKIEGKNVEELWQGTKKDKEKVLREVARRNAFESLKAEDYEKILPETAEKYKEFIVKYGRERQGIRRMLEKGMLDWNTIEGEINRLGRREVAKTNSPVLLLPYTPVGRSVGARPPVDRQGREINESAIRKIISEIQSKSRTWEETKNIMYGTTFQPTGGGPTGGGPTGGGPTGGGPTGGGQPGGGQPGGGQPGGGQPGGGQPGGGPT